MLVVPGEARSFLHCVSGCDRGSTYTSIRFAQRLADNGILPSMGSVGDSYDNALMENFFSTLKIELVYRNSWRTRDEAENAIFSYIDGPCCAIGRPACGATDVVRDHLVDLAYL
uniref:transposase n=1 Tax=Lentzea alba TaxID=2714351 RepID=UPI0039BFEBA8